MMLGTVIESAEYPFPQLANVQCRKKFRIATVERRSEEMGSSVEVVRR